MDSLSTLGQILSVFCRQAEEDQRTPRERTLPCLEVLGDLRHFDVGVKFVNLIQDGVFVVVAEVIRGLLLGRVH